MVDYLNGRNLLDSDLSTLLLLSQFISLTGIFTAAMNITDAYASFAYVGCDIL